MTETPKLKRVLTVRDVALFNVAVVFGLRSMATAAKMGPLAITLWIVAILAFFVPHALSIMELGSRDAGEGGLYRWTRDAFGERHGFLVGWFYWVSTLAYLPTVLISFSAAIAYALGVKALGDSPMFVLSESLGVLLLATWIGIRGLSIGRWATNIGALATWLGALLLISAGVYAAVHFGSATVWSAHAFFGGAANWRTFGYFGTLSFACVGLELAGVMGGEIREPSRTIPRAITLASVTIAVLYLAGTAAILTAAPAEQVNPVSGAIGAIDVVGQRVGWPFLAPLLGFMLALGLFAGFTAWLTATARLPYAIGIDSALPAAFAELHPKYGTPYKAILLQAGITAVLVIASQAGSTVNEAFLLLLDGAIVMNFIPFLYIFLAMPRLRPETDAPGVIRIPGGRGVLWFVALLGFTSSLISLISAVIPPPDGGNIWMFEARLWGGLAVFSAAGLLLYRRFNRQ